MSRRAPVVAGTTVVAMIGLLSFHTHSTSGILAPAGQRGSTRPTTSTPATKKSPSSPSATSPAATGSSGGSTSSGSSGGSTSSGSSGGSTSSGSSGGSTSSGSSAPATPTTTTVTGTIVQYGYGELAVSVTLSGSSITGVAVPTLQTAEPYSQQLATQVIPMLRQEVLQAQSANINGISGATYTSEAFTQSLQSALHKAPKK